MGDDKNIMDYQGAKFCAFSEAAEFYYWSYSSQ
jgi:hypothetical protein